MKKLTAAGPCRFADHVEGLGLLLGDRREAVEDSEQMSTPKALS